METMLPQMGHDPRNRKNLAASPENSERDNFAGPVVDVTFRRVLKVVAARLPLAQDPREDTRQYTFALRMDRPFHQTEFQSENLRDFGELIDRGVCPALFEVRQTTQGN
jgi:hypothetical protein